MNRRSVAVALAGLLTGCALADAEQDDDTWIEVGVLQFAGDGETAILDIPPGEPLVALALRATTDPGVCFQLSSVVDGDGRAPIDGRSAGAYCRDCELRTAVAVEAGVFVLPREEGRLDPELGLSLRFARVDCQTLTPLTRPEDRPALRVEMRPIAAVPARATIDLRFHVADSSILFGDEARQQALMAALEWELAPAGLTPRLMAGLDCFAETAGPIDLPVDAQARVLAHEIGHYLGLYHAVEVDGLADPLADTDSDNIMNPRPTLASAVGFTPSQGRVMRMHRAARVTSPPPSAVIHSVIDARSPGLVASRQGHRPRASSTLSTITTGSATSNSRPGVSRRDHAAAANGGVSCQRRSRTAYVHHSAEKPRKIAWNSHAIGGAPSRMDRAIPRLAVSDHSTLSRSIPRNCSSVPLRPR